MAQEGQVDASALLSHYRAFITYRPLRTETNALEHAHLPFGARIHEIPPRASLDPHEEAKAARAFAGDRPTAILLPGREFDAAGTRHGQGGGWYDRFLKEVPREWLRVGFCFSDQFSKMPLPRQPWDEPVDYVVVVDRQTDSHTLYSTEGVPT